MIVMGKPKLSNSGDWLSILNNFRKYVKPNHVVLEIGASTKERTVTLSKYCRKVIGVELFTERMPKSSANIKYINGDWQKLSNILKPNSIDIALSTHVLEHVPNDLKALNELYKVLKPGGIALIQVPNRKRLTRSVIEIFTGERKFPYLEHMREYTEDDIHKLLKATKFNQSKIVPVSLGLHGGYYYLYTHYVPYLLRRFAHVWEVHLIK